MNEQEQIFFVKGMLPHANSAETVFHLNPIVTLAQAALESGWGKSNLALKGNNFFGLTAYGKSNDYWHGGVITLANGADALPFRRYDTVNNSFLDFARLIKEGYRMAWSFSRNIEAYAKEIAYSRYISEQNGDNRELYRRSLVSLAKRIQTIVSLINHNR